ncbi:MAG: mycofactocin biosynthesis chaperone MftB [Nocardioidaceae bacterium]
MPTSAPVATSMLAEPWRLDGSVALRPEPFGALAYHFGTRRLSFLKTPELVDVVRRLEHSPTVQDALVGAGVPEPHWPAYTHALAGLARGGMITRRDDA